MEHPKFKWCRETIANVRFKPDRDKIWDELIAHIEDRTEDMKSRGYTQEEAETRAVAAMGDPEEVGKQLNAVHKPWLGRLWIVSKVLVILCLIALVLVLLTQHPLRWFNYDDSSFWETERSEYVTVIKLNPVCEDKSDGYTFTVPHAKLTHTAAHTVETENGPYDVEAFVHLSLIVQATRLLPTAEKCRAFHDFYAVDDLGNVYESVLEYISWEQALLGNYEMKNPWSTVYRCWIEELDPAAEWVELRYDRDGRDVCLRICLTGGEQV